MSAKWQRMTPTERRRHRERITQSGLAVQLSAGLWTIQRKDETPSQAMNRLTRFAAPTPVEPTLSRHPEAFDFDKSEDLATPSLWRTFVIFVTVSLISMLLTRVILELL
jgi:hypothetical protein